MKYICKEGFAVEEYDDDGWPTDKYMTVEPGEVYEVNDDWHRVAGGLSGSKTMQTGTGSNCCRQQSTNTLSRQRRARHERKTDL